MMIYWRNFAVKQGNICCDMGFDLIKYYYDSTISTVFDQHEIQIRTSWYWWSRFVGVHFLPREISQRWSGGPKGFLRKAGNADGVSRAIASRFWAILRNTEKVSLRAIPAMNIDIKS